MHRYGLSSTFENREVQAEYFVPLEHAVPALRAVWATAKARRLGGSELRVVRGDDHWLSPCGGEMSIDCTIVATLQSIACFRSREETKASAADGF